MARRLAVPLLLLALLLVSVVVAAAAFTRSLLPARCSTHQLSRCCSTSCAMTRMALPQFGRRELLAGGATVATWGVLLGATLSDDEEYGGRKRRLFSVLGSVTGGGEGGALRVLEVGIGGNPTLGGFTNLGYYPPGTQLVGVDPALEGGRADGEIRAAQAKALRGGVSLTALGGRAEQLPMPSASFDAVVSTLVFCSVEDPLRCMREVARVLRPGGVWLFMEHVASPQPGLLRTSQELLDPLQAKLASGCHLTRRTEDLLLAHTARGQGAWAFGGEEVLFSRVEGLERFAVGSRWPASTQVMGVAIK